jgi:hypothetical protein
VQELIAGKSGSKETGESEHLLEPVSLSRIPENACENHAEKLTLFFTASSIVFNTVLR